MTRLPKKSDTDPSSQFPEDVELFADVLGALMRHVTAEWINTDISTAQIKVILALHFAGARSVSQLAQALDIGAPTASHLVEKLVKAGLAVRIESTTDRRVTHVHLTERGHDMASRMSGLNQKHVIAQWMSQLSNKHRTSLASTLRTLAAAARMTSIDGKEGDQSNKD
jgi:DNA-binding MarR family transcriptional regulator